MAVALTVLEKHVETAELSASLQSTSIGRSDLSGLPDSILQVSCLKLEENVSSTTRRLRVLAALSYDIDTGKYLMIGIGRDSPTIMPIEPGILLCALKILGLNEDEGGATEQKAGKRYALLSQRELQVLQGVADGFSNKEIAQKLDIRENTTKRHLQRIFAKLGVLSRTQAVTHALAHGWITLQHAQIEQA